MLQYITNTDCDIPVVQQIFAVIEGGCRWVQVRMKDSDDDEIREVVEAVKKKCIEKDVFLILNDRVDLAKELNVGGVHLGKEDMPCSQARTILGPAAVIGVTANTLTDIIAVSSLDIDYFGLGPFASTSTKKRLAPILGIDGMRELCKNMTATGVNIPRVAVGGIKRDDVIPLLKAGVNGIAVSGSIAFANDMVKETEAFVSLLKNNDNDKPI